MPFWNVSGFALDQKSEAGTKECASIPGVRMMPPRTANGWSRERNSIRRSAMALNLTQKKDVVAEVAEVAAKAHSLIAAEYAGTTVTQMTAMRKKARETGVFLKVVKNTLAARAVDGTEFEVAKNDLVGPLLYAFSTEEPGAAGRLIKEFAKGNDKLQPKLVVVGGQQYPASHVEVLASLPTLEQALGMLARVLAEPATMFARAVKAVADQQGGGDAAPAVEAEPIAEPA